MKVVYAPEPTLKFDAHDTTRSAVFNCITAVQIQEDEEVEWIWTHTPAGSYVSSYNILKKV